MFWSFSVDKVIPTLISPRFFLDFPSGFNKQYHFSMPEDGISFNGISTLPSKSYVVFPVDALTVSLINLRRPLESLMSPNFLNFSKLERSSVNFLNFLNFPRQKVGKAQKVQTVNLMMMKMMMIAILQMKKLSPTNNILATLTFQSILRPSLLNFIGSLKKIQWFLAVHNVAQISSLCDTIISERINSLLDHDKQVVSRLHYDQHIET